MIILIVDDELPAVRSLERVVRKVVPDGTIYTTDESKEAISICRQYNVDIAFLDVEMAGMDGITLAKELKKIRPDINVVMATAYAQYSLEAFKIFASGYVLKPVSEADVKEVLSNLRNPVEYKHKGLYIQCFGNFEVFYDGEIVTFGRSQAKEILAYLIDRNGAAASSGELIGVLFGDDKTDVEKQRNYFYHLFSDLQNTLAGYGCEDILVRGRNSYAVDTEKVKCDYYRAFRKEITALNSFRGEYMSQYSWAEERLAVLTEEL